MFKNTLTRFVALISVLILIAILALSTLSIYETRSFAKKEKEALVQISIKNLSQTINSFMAITSNDFNHLYAEESQELQKVLDAQAENAGAFIFITDANGKILIESQSSQTPEDSFQSIDKNYLAIAAESAARNEVFYSDFGGAFEDKRINSGIVMQKKFVYSTQQTKYQTVGMLFVSAPAEINGAWVIVIPIIAVLIAVTVLLFAVLFIIIERKIMAPLREISAVSKSFAHGDFSARAVCENADADIAVLAADINEMAEKIESSEKSTNSFIASLSHDLRTPMTTIDGYIQNIIEGVIPPDKYKHYFGIIHSETQRLSKRVSQMLEMSRSDAGQKKYNFERYDICESARLGLISFGNRLDEKQIDVEFETNEDRIFVYADNTSVSQVIYNLIDNAIKFTPEKGKLSINIESKEGKAYIAVYNTGDGIPPEELPRLFERYYKSDRSRELDKSGTGLGLYIAKSIIQAHGEDIWVTSEYGKFCKFVFTLPLSDK